MKIWKYLEDLWNFEICLRKNIAVLFSKVSHIITYHHISSHIITYHHISSHIITYHHISSFLWEIGSHERSRTCIRTWFNRQCRTEDPPGAPTVVASSRTQSGLESQSRERVKHGQMGGVPLIVVPLTK